MKSNVVYSTSRGVGYGLVGGFVGALILGAIASMMPINGVPFFVAAVMMMGVMGSMAVAAGWVLHIITGLIIGVIFGALTSKVRQIQASSISKGLGLGAVTGIIVWIVFFVPLGSMLASSMHMSLMSMGAAMIGGSFVGHLIFGLVMGGIVGVLLPRSSSESFKCQSCGATFSSQAELMNHGRMHMKSGQPQQQSFKCNACGASFGSQQELMDHAKKSHPMPAR
ncbi:MAG: C2H2-type zinc finger protein [Nitrososphaerota archaeon]|nr:C2H2-type zinc finger protein [Nitrososphaerota archaeon]